tara:strand:- start:3313 stop:3672 length:360 start_codon:yes stop_codon:yes gene_type:complete
MAYESNFEPALQVPVNFSVSDNKYEPTKAKYSKKISLFIPLETAVDFAQHILNVADKPENHAKGKVFDLRTGSREEVDGIYIYGNGNVSNFDEDDFGAYGTINPRKVVIETTNEEEVPF